MISLRALASPIFTTIVIIAVVLPAFAQTQPVVISNAAGARTQICNVFNTIFWALISVSTIMVLWAAYLYVTARDDAERTTKARRVILYAAYGITAGLLARGFPLMVASIFPGGTQGVQGC